MGRITCHGEGRWRSSSNSRAFTRHLPMTSLTRPWICKPYWCYYRVFRSKIPTFVLDKIRTLHLTCMNLCSRGLQTNWIQPPDEEAKAVVEQARKKEDGFFLKEKVVYKDQRLYVPIDKRTPILYNRQNSPFSYHGGTLQTKERLKQFWWLLLDDEKRVKTCEICQNDKFSTHKTPARWKLSKWTNQRNWSRWIA